MTPRRLSDILRPYGVEPVKSRDGKGEVRGYLQLELDDLFERHKTDIIPMFKNRASTPKQTVSPVSFTREIQGDSLCDGLKREVSQSCLGSVSLCDPATSSGMSACDGSCDGW